MRLLIASDLHGSLDGAKFILEKSQELKPDLCVFLGDFLYHGPRNPLPLQYTPKDVAYWLGQIEAEIVAVRGNCDALVDEDLLPFPIVESSWIYADNLRILAAHGHQYGRNNPDFSRIPANTVMLTGHTHIPIADMRDGKDGKVAWWNPGSIALPKSGYPKTYAICEDGEFSIYNVDDNKLFLRHKAKF